MSTQDISQHTRALRRQGVSRHWVLKGSRRPQRTLHQQYCRKSENPSRKWQPHHSGSCVTALCGDNNFMTPRAPVFSQPAAVRAGTEEQRPLLALFGPLSERGCEVRLQAALKNSRKQRRCSNYPSPCGHRQVRENRNRRHLLQVELQGSETFQPHSPQKIVHRKTLLKQARRWLLQTEGSPE